MIDIQRSRAMITRKEAIQFCNKFTDVYADYPFRDPNWTIMRHKANKKVFAWIFEKDNHIWINVKVDPEWRDFFRSAYKSVTAGFHLNKEHWNSIILDGRIPTKEIERIIGESYDLTKPKKRKS